MQLSSILGQQFKALNQRPTQQSAPVEPTRNHNYQDKVTLSPEAQKEFEKLAAYPSSIGEYLPKVNTLNNTDAHKIGYATWETSFRDSYKLELKEYGDKFNAYYNQTKAEFGIHNAYEHYEKVIKPEGNNPAFQHAFEDKLRSDPRMLQLMNVLGIKQPA